MRAAALTIAKAGNCSVAKTGYRYGSEAPLIELVYRRVEFFEADIAVHMTLKDELRFLVQMQILNSKVRYGIH